MKLAEFCFEVMFAERIFIDRVALAKQGDNALGSVRPSVRPFVSLSVCPSWRMPKTVDRLLIDIILSPTRATNNERSSTGLYIPRQRFLFRVQVTSKHLSRDYQTYSDIV